MTNFTKFREKIKGIIKEEGCFSAAVINGELLSCDDVKCESCEFYAKVGMCEMLLLEWLTEEYVEKAKPTDEERIRALQETRDVAENIILLSEEMGELQQALSKWYRSRSLVEGLDNTERNIFESDIERNIFENNILEEMDIIESNILEEMADVTICIQIIMSMLGFSQKMFSEEYGRKLTRDYERIKKKV